MAGWFENFVFEKKPKMTKVRESMKVVAERLLIAI